MTEKGLVVYRVLVLNVLAESARRLVDVATLGAWARVGRSQFQLDRHCKKPGIDSS